MAATFPSALFAQSSEGSPRPLPPDLNSENGSTGTIDDAKLQSKSRMRHRQRVSKNQLPPANPKEGTRPTDLTVRPAASPISKQSTYEHFQVIWADDDQSVDTLHLVGTERAILGQAAGSGTAFTLTPQLLEQICSNNAFSPIRRNEAPFVLFGLRGAIAPAIPTDWSSNVELNLIQPDHINPRCVIGVWYRGKDRPQSLRVFPGSTVPNAHYMAKQILSPGDESNLCPTGLHRFIVGFHDEIIGAFRQGDAYPTHRLGYKRSETPHRTDLCFTNDANRFSRPHLAEPIEIKSVHVNLHPARAPETLIKFSSAGCQVVVGDQFVDGPRDHQKAASFWADFRKAAGLPDPPTTARDGDPYDYILINAREALLTARASSEQQKLLGRLRFGSIDAKPNISNASSRVKVSALQKALVAACRIPGPLADLAKTCMRPEDYTSDGRFSGGTMRLAMAWQKINRGHADGIVDLDMLQKLGLS